MTEGVVTIHLGRCGSTVLGDMLEQHSGITWAGELFEPLFARARKKLGEKFYVQIDPIKAMRERLEAAETAVYGIEVKPFHSGISG